MPLHKSLTNRQKVRQHRIPLAYSQVLLFLWIQLPWFYMTNPSDLFLISSLVHKLFLECSNNLTRSQTSLKLAESSDEHAPQPIPTSIILGTVAKIWLYSDASSATACHGKGLSWVLYSSDHWLASLWLQLRTSSASLMPFPADARFVSFSLGTQLLPL